MKCGICTIYYAKHVFYILLSLEKNISVLVCLNTSECSYKHLRGLLAIRVNYWHFIFWPIDN